MIFQLFLNAFFRVLLITVFVVASCTGEPRAEATEARAVPEEVGAEPTTVDVPTDTVEHAADATATGYDFTRPAASVELPRELREISGIAYLQEGQVLGVQDERGRIYVIDYTTGHIIHEIEFEGKGDYEDVALVDGRVYVLQSNGTLYLLDAGWQDGKPDVRELKTTLDSKCDAEGLAYDANGRRLIIACKEDPGKDAKGERVFYGYDVAADVLTDEPVFRVEFDELERLDGEDLGGDVRDFKPSAIAIHPGTGEMFVLSSVLKIIVVLNPSGELMRVYKLDEVRFPQPEGLAFFPDGDLLISNEGPKGPATLLRFVSER